MARAKDVRVAKDCLVADKVRGARHVEQTDVRKAVDRKVRGCVDVGRDVQSREKPGCALDSKRREEVGSSGQSARSLEIGRATDCQGRKQVCSPDDSRRLEDVRLSSHVQCEQVGSPVAVDVAEKGIAQVLGICQEGGVSKEVGRTGHIETGQI